MSEDFADYTTHMPTAIGPSRASLRKDATAPFRGKNMKSRQNRKRIFAPADIADLERKRGENNKVSPGCFSALCAVGRARMCLRGDACLMAVTCVRARAGELRCVFGGDRDDRGQRMLVGRVGDDGWAARNV